MTRIIATFIFICWSSYAGAQLLHGVTDALSGGGIPGPPPTGCDGTINLSTGCVQPMLR